MAILNSIAFKKLLDEMFQWRMKATYAPIEELDADQLKYRKDFEEDCKRFEAKFGTTWDEIFNGTKKS